MSLKRARNAPAGFAAAAVLSLIFLSAGSGERPRIEISDANFKPLPIAVTEPKIIGNPGKKGARVAADIAAVMRNDFEISGLFEVLNPRGFIADPAKEGIETGEINFADWVNVGAEALVKAGLKMDVDTAEVEVKLFEIGGAREALKKSFKCDLKDVRRSVHVFANDVVRFYTGEPGIFSTQILAIRGSGDQKDVWVMDFDGYGEKRLTNNDVIDILPTWSPDGRQIAFTSYMGGNPDLWTMDLVTRKLSVISKNPGLDMGASWSPDGKKIALTISLEGNSEIFVMNADGSNQKRLTKDWGIDASPSWSPNGTRIAFVSDRAGSPQLYLMNSDGSDQKRLTYQGNYNQQPRWSPRGDRILFTARDERRMFDIFSVDPDTGKISRLTQDQGNNMDPTWAPNGRLCAFVSTRDGAPQVYVSSPDGSNQRRITTGGNYSNPVWGPLPGN